MAKGILTNREVKNKVTGVDIYVSDYQEIPHRITEEYLYHVIVVSNLFYYKTREHRESDVVQFMVSKTFAEFEDLYNRLSKRFPSVNFPPLPEKSLSGNAGGNLECMDKVLKMVASTQKLSSSPMVISFLRGDVVTNVKDEEVIEVPEVEEEPSELPVESSEPCDNNDIEFHDVDLFDAKAQVVVEDIIYTENIETVSSEKSIFDDDCGTAENDADLFITADTKTSIYNKEYDLDGDLDLLDLSDDVDELMSLSKTSEKQLSIKVHKPQPVKQRVNQSKGSGNILGDEPNGKEDMFKKSKHKSFWRDQKHNTIDDIFGPKKTSFFDMDDGDDLFRTATTKVAVKVEHMKEEDNMDYITEHNDNFVPTEQSDTFVIEQNNISVTEPNYSSEPTEQTDSSVTEQNGSTIQAEQADTYVTEQTDSSVPTGQNSSVVEQNGSLIPTEHTGTSVTEQTDSSGSEQSDSSVVEQNVSSIPTEQSGTSVTGQTDGSASEQRDSYVGEQDDSSVQTKQNYCSVTEGNVNTILTEQNDIFVTEQKDSFVSSQVLNL